MLVRMKSELRKRQHIVLTVFWSESPCSLVDRYRRFGGSTYHKYTM